MSYDLMVFECSKAPKNRENFLTWYNQQTQWNEGHTYMDPAITSPALREWFLEMKDTFPQMNGPYAPDDDTLDAMDEAGTDNYVTDYSIGKDVIYAAFAWSLTDEAHAFTRKLALKHGVGFFDVSAAEGEILFPDGTIL